MTSKTVTVGVYDFLSERRFLPTPLPNDGFDDVPDPLPGTFSAGRFTGDWVSDPAAVTLTWADDFTPEQEAEWSLAVKRARRRVEDVDSEADPHIAVLKQWRDRTGPATDVQRDAVLDAMMNLWRLNLKEED